MAKNAGNSMPMQAGIISFKNLGNGFLPFTSKIDSKHGEFEITETTLHHYLKELKNLILEICNPEIPFIEKIV